jgi:hypothetical protein
VAAYKKYRPVFAVFKEVDASSPGTNQTSETMPVDPSAARVSSATGHQGEGSPNKHSE